jgi:transcription-repair coupling factor (superfamily II helicase)
VLIKFIKIVKEISKINNNTYLFPMDDFLTSEALAISPELKSIRINTLNEICNSKENNIIITNLMGYLRYLPEKKLWINNKIILKKNDELNKEELFKKLVDIGYSNEILVSKTGEVANRGYIIDIFPLTNDNPIRIEFWGDFIESIRFFDVESQRSLEEIDEFELTPYSEFINEKQIENIEELQKYLPFVVNNISSIKEYLENPIIIYKDYNQLKNAYKSLREEIFEYNNSKSSIYDTNYMI